MSHPTERCSTPKPAKRWRNTIWVCPNCDHAWVLRYSIHMAPNRIGDPEPPVMWDAPAWQWFPWSPR